MPPYLNGKPLALEGALPLGMIEAAVCSVMHFRLHEGDRLTLMSDGIVEAADGDGELFGFERTEELARSAASAAEIAAAAQRFGQEDDISVISVVRRAGFESGAFSPQIQGEESDFSASVAERMIANSQTKQLPDVAAGR